MQESPAYTLHKLVFTLDRIADRMLQAEFGISHKRALFLIILHSKGPMTQHALAQALGYTDPAVSSMLIELTRQDYVVIEPSLEHGRKRIVSLTPKGDELAAKGEMVRDEQFAKLLKSADVDASQYMQMTEQIYQALTKEES